LFSFCYPCLVGNSFKRTEKIIPLIEGFIAQYDKLNELETNFTLHQSFPICMWPKDFLSKMNERGQLMSLCQLHRKSGLILDTELNVLLCNALHQTPIGKARIDFNDEIELDAFFKSKKIVNIYKTLLSSPIENCSTCEDFVNCAGGCLLQTIH